MISLGSVRAGGKALAQNVPVTGGRGVNLLLTDPDDFNAAVLLALKQFDLDSQNVRVVDVTIASSGFRLVLKGSGAAAELAGADAWASQSALLAVWSDFDITEQGVDPMDPNVYRIVLDPGPKTVLELLADRFTAAQVARLAFTRPHALTEAPNTVVDPTTAPTVSLAGSGSGSVTNGLHGYVYTWLTAQGETIPSAAATVTVTDQSTDGKVTVVVPASDDYGVTGAKVYRTIAGNTGAKKLVGTLTTNGGTLTDSIADVSLGANAPSANTAGGANTVDDDDEQTLTALVGSVILQMAANKLAQNTGNTNLPSDVVDRRSQSDIFRSRSKELREFYQTLVGKGAGTDLAARSAFQDLDVEATYGNFLFHGNRT